MAGLNDRDLQQLCTAQIFLNHLVEFCNAYDNGKLSQATTVAALKSTHQKDKTNLRPSPTTCEYCAGPTHEGTNREDRAVECPAYGAMCVQCSKQHHTSKARKSSKPEPNKVSAIHYDAAEVTTGKHSQQNHPGDPQSSHRSGSPAQPQVSKTISNTTVQFPTLHFEFDPYLANRVQTSPRPPSMPLVALRLHEKSYAHLNGHKPMDHPPCKPQIGQATTPPKVNTRAVADTGAKTDIISLPTLKSVGFDPDTFIKAFTVVGQNFPKIGAATSRTPRPFVPSTPTPFIPVTQTQECCDQGCRLGTTLGDAMIRDVTAYDSHQLKLKTPQNMVKDRTFALF